ncbi:hypothetical protein [Pragia fontium]|uniref:hypothetical protein n=1 Tax=Pragia fontium TaxID=82985 RepID=UPI000E028E87|nr:hypothetical protein [Pragia fontium]SUB82563.1 Uncharacterised protein [Pragia fontium]VEJ55462.1 Uncharacterised protein [Pragia fontium]
MPSPLLLVENQITYQQATQVDYSAILTMAEPFYPDSPSANASTGFLNKRFTEPMLASMNESLGLLIAQKDGGQVIGFLGLSPFTTQSPSPVVNAMLKVLNTLSYHGQRIEQLRPFVFGPICVAAEAKGLGVFKNLYRAMWQFLPAPAYNVGLAFIDKNNQHSLDAHIKGLGAEIIGEFSVHQSLFWIIAYSRVK